METQPFYGGVNVREDRIKVIQGEVGLRLNGYHLTHAVHRGV